MGKRTLIAISIGILFGCSNKKAPNHFSDPLTRSIADFQDRRLTDSLYKFLSSSDSRYRSEATLAFASIQDTAASQRLGTLLLEDTSVQVRSNAAFALGQTGGVDAVNALIPAANDSHSTVVREVLEALGKTASGADLELLKNYRATDSIAEEGLAWGFYRLALRNKTDTQMVARQIEFLTARHTFQTRLAAAHFFNQSSVPGGKYEVNLIRAALEDPSPEVRIAAVAGLRKVKDENALDALRRVLERENDYRVRISAVRSLQGFPVETIRPLLTKALHDSHQMVAIAASEIVPTLFHRSDDGLVDEAHVAKNVRVKANLYKAILATGPYSPALLDEAKQNYLTSGTDYQRAHWLRALSAVSSTFPFIAEELLKTNAYVVRTSAALALSDINYHNDFTPAMQKEMVSIFKKAILLGDPAVIAIFAETLSDPVLDYRQVIPDIAFLREAKGKLQLPKDIESLQPVEYAIAYFEGKDKPAPLKNQFNHAIDWSLAATLDNEQRVLVKTSRGDLTIRLFVEESPGSVVNFVNLIKAKYFDGRFFHRVVPNFVVQTGCNRGDGFGSEDFSIRSEFSRRRYTTGSIGMASAGKDTEGTQWFITHSPTPHLGGRYTIFAEVEKGMDVVEQLEVGDVCTTVSLIEE